MVKYYTGPRGGKYYRKNGRKIYVSSKKRASPTKKKTSRKKVSKKKVSKKEAQRSRSMARCRKSKKYERCVLSVKRRNKRSKRSYNPWAVCTNSVCKKYKSKNKK